MIIFCRSNGAWNLYSTGYFLGFNCRDDEISGRYFSKHWIKIILKNPFPYGFWYGIKNKAKRLIFKLKHRELWSIETSVLPNKIYFSRGR